MTYFTELVGNRFVVTSNFSDNTRNIKLILEIRFYRIETVS